MPMKVKIAGAWQRATAKVKLAGEWESAQTWVKAGGAWSRVGVQDWDLHSDNHGPRGITWDGTYFYVVDWIDLKVHVYVYDRDGNHQSDRSFDLDFSNSNPVDIASDGTYVYVVNRAYTGPNDRVYAYRGGSFRTTRSFFLYNRYPRGIASDGTYLYVADSVDRKVYVYDADGNHQSDRRFDLHADNGSPEGITSDGTYLYVVDGSDDKVYVYDADGNHVG